MQSLEKEIGKTKKEDVAYSTLKAIISSLPFVGSAASELLGLIVAPPLEKRREKWMKEVSEKLIELSQKDNIDLVALSQNEQFIDIVIQTTSLALKTSQQEKIQAFKNIITNTAKRQVTDETKAQIFLLFVDNFTSWHLKILHLFDNPHAWYKSNGRKPRDLFSGSLSSVLNDAFPELKNERELTDLIWDDLKRAGLHNSGTLQGTMTGEGIMSNRTTNLGKQFIEFISYND